MARKTNPAASVGCLLMIVGFVVTMAFDLIGGIMFGGIIIFAAGAVLGLLGALAGIISDLFGLGKDEGSSQIIVMGQKEKDKEAETDEDGYNPDLPAYLREPKKKKPGKKKK